MTESYNVDYTRFKTPYELMSHLEQMYDSTQITLADWKRIMDGWRTYVKQPKQEPKHKQEPETEYVI